MKEKHPIMVAVLTIYDYERNGNRQEKWGGSSCRPYCSLVPRPWSGDETIPIVDLGVFFTGNYGCTWGPALIPPKGACKFSWFL